jgi:hypothetical protein
VNSVKKRSYKNTPGRTRTSDLRIRNPLDENDKPLNINDLTIQESGAYKPAYKNNPKIGSNQDKNDTRNLPTDLAEIVAVWPELSEHIKAAIKALIQIHKAEKK